jgi:hypothetical protein
MSNHILYGFNLGPPGDYNNYTNVNNTTLTAAVTPSQNAATLGICLPRDEKTDQTLAPCIRVNGKLMPNPEHRSCRSFSKYVGATGVCRTTPPDACVELWESCPAGTGVLTSVVHTKSPQHLMQLMGNTVGGAYEELFETNPYFDSQKNYHSYTECYGIGNQFCEFPESKLLTASGVQNCYKDCPIGTTEDPSDQKTCTFNGSQVQCNPQYYEQTNTACIKKPLGTQSVATCPANHETFVNDQFTVEWCMPKCPPGFVHDVTYTSCIPLCRGSSDEAWNRSANHTIYQDLLDFYASSVLPDVTNQLRCGTYNGESKICSLANQPGRCPVNKYITPISVYANSHKNVSIRPNGMPVRQFSKESLPKKHRTAALDSAYQSDLQTTLTNLENNFTYILPVPSTALTPLNDSNTTVCPDGMVTALPNTLEKTGYCYDECPTGFNSAEICRTTGEMTLSGTLQCQDTDIQYICVADCPAGWRSKVLTGNIQTCEYIYPNNKVPSDPALFVPCPDNGTFLPFTMSDTTGPLGQSLKPTPPICVRKVIQRNSACPKNYFEVNGQCIEGCQQGYIPIKQSDGTFTCMQSCPTDNRMSSGMESMQSPGLQDDAQCIRKPQTNGPGLDPVSLLHSQDTSGIEKGFIILAIVFVSFTVLQRFFF